MDLEPRRCFKKFDSNLTAAIQSENEENVTSHVVDNLPVNYAHLKELKCPVTAKLVIFSKTKVQNLVALLEVYLPDHCSESVNST